MNRMELLKSLVRKAESKTVLLILDGLGGLAGPDGKTELESANVPHLHSLAAKGICGMMDPVARGITPGSGPGHLALFGYDPFRFEIGRGALEAAGADFNLQRGDVATRVNFCTLDKNGNVTDRRAGRISTEKNRQFVTLLRQIKVSGAEVFVETVKEHRALVVLRGQSLGEKLADTDPQKTGVPPLEVKALDEASKKTAKIVSEFLEKAREVLKDQHPANGLLLRGFSTFLDLSTFQELYRLNPAAIATYPMYRGVAKYAGMKILDTGSTFADEIQTLSESFDDFDFFFLHFKYTDSRGEDGNFREKVKCIEEVDALLPNLLKLKPDVLVITADHSTPCSLKAHSWHAVPILLISEFARTDSVMEFTEKSCTLGGLGRFPAQELMGLILAHSGRLEKFGA